MRALCYVQKCKNKLRFSIKSWLKKLCTNHKGYEILVELAKTSDDQKHIQASAIRALAALLDKNPDGFNVEGFAVVLMGLDSSKGIVFQIVTVTLYSSSPIFKLILPPPISASVFDQQ